MYAIYPPYLKSFAQNMRKNPTDAERKFWSIVKNKQTGYKFRRQHPINSQYIADFVCVELRLIIEIDSSQHYNNPNDKQRTFQIETEGFRIIRFWNNEILENLEGCYEVLMREIHSAVRASSPTQTLPPQKKIKGGRALREIAHSLRSNAMTIFF